MASAIRIAIQGMALLRGLPRSLLEHVRHTTCYTSFLQRMQANASPLHPKTKCVPDILL